MFIVTGGYSSDTHKKVSRYSINGWMNDLPELNEARFQHGCGYYFNEDMERVSFKGLNRGAKGLFLLPGVSGCWRS